MGTIPGDISQLQQVAADLSTVNDQLQSIVGGAALSNEQFDALAAWVVAKFPGATVTRLTRDPFVGVIIPIFVPVTTSGVITPVDPIISGIGGGTTFVVQWLDQLGHAMSPQPATAWSSGNTGIATINAVSGLATAIAVGVTSIKAVSADNGTIALNNPGITITTSVNYGPGPNLPGGLTVILNTQAMTTGPSQSPNGTWVTNGYTWTNLSPNPASPQGEWSGNVSLDPSGIGLRITYPTNLTAGYSPTRLYAQVSGSGAGSTGLLYIYRVVTFSSNWTSAPVATGVKSGEPRTTSFGSGNGNNENHVLDFTYDGTTDGTKLQPGLFLQGPNGRFPFYVPPNPATGLVTGGATHTVEEILQQEAIPGQATGTYKCWVDGVQISNFTGIQYLYTGQQIGWVSNGNFTVDPTYGGGGGSPPAQQYWTIGSIYMARG